MKATCTKSPAHDEFITVAHVAQDWIVDAEGNFIRLPENTDEQVVARPDPGNSWTCAICGAEATVK